MKVLEELKKAPGIMLTPEDPAFCSASCHPVVINSRLKGGIVIPMVDDYPFNKLEVICHVNVRETLPADAGDEIELELI